MFDPYIATKHACHGMIHAPALPYVKTRRRQVATFCAQAFDADRGQRNVASSDRLAKGLPPVDWTRYHLQILFVDRTDTVRARVGAGLFENISEWNGYGRAMVPATCGVEAKPGQHAPWSTQASLMQQAFLLGVEPRKFGKPAEKLDLVDLDCHDLVVALDSSVRQYILDTMVPEHREYYEKRIALLTDFSSYPGRAEVLRRGGTALLPHKMSRLLASRMEQILSEKEISSPNLQDANGLQDWNTMVEVTMLGCAGLVKYLIDSYPDDLPEYDPL